MSIRNFRLGKPTAVGDKKADDDQATPAHLAFFKGEDPAKVVEMITAERSGLSQAGSNNNDSAVPAFVKAQIDNLMDNKGLYNLRLDAAEYAILKYLGDTTHGQNMQTIAKEGMLNQMLPMLDERVQQGDPIAIQLRAKLKTSPAS